MPAVLMNPEFLLLLVLLLFILLSLPDEEPQDLDKMTDAELLDASYFEEAGGTWPNVYSREYERRRAG